MPERRKKVRELRDKMNKYRGLARLVSDTDTRRRILELTGELEQEALEIERTIED